MGSYLHLSSPEYSQRFFVGCRPEARSSPLSLPEPSPHWTLPPQEAPPAPRNIISGWLDGCPNSSLCLPPKSALGRSPIFSYRVSAEFSELDVLECQVPWRMHAQKLGQNVLESKALNCFIFYHDEEPDSSVKISLLQKIILTIMKISFGMFSYPVLVHLVQTILAHSLILLV